MDRGILANAIGFSGEAPMDQRVKDEVLATYAVYAKAFLANDIHAIDQLIQYPLAYIGDGRTTDIAVSA
jgi:hypothetical protein